MQSGILKTFKSAKDTAKDRRFIKWLSGGLTIYALPSITRLATKNQVIPLLNSLDYYVSPIGLGLEKFLVTPFYPVGVGGMAGEIFVSKYRNENLNGGLKYLAR